MAYSTVLKLPQYVRNLQRLKEILAILVKHGLGDLFGRLNLPKQIISGVRLVYPALLDPSNSDLSFDERLLQALEELGPTFIKLGQFLANRPDLVPTTLALKLSKLEDSVAPFDSKLAREIIERELNCSIDTVFAEFGEEPIAAGSIAQVHTATLLNGEKVVVKIKRPGIERVLFADLEILLGLAKMAEEQFKSSLSFNPLEILDEISKQIRKEVDFKSEVQNTEVFYGLAEAHPLVQVPRTYPDFSSTCIFVEERISGNKISSEIAQANFAKLDRRTLAEALTLFTLEGVFKHGVFHADPHPGNIFLTTDNSISLIDFGLTGRVDTTRVNQVVEFLGALLSKDLDKCIRCLQEIHPSEPIADANRLRRDLAEIIDLALQPNSERPKVFDFIMKLLGVLRMHKLNLPADLAMSFKALASLDQTAKYIDPTFSIVEELKPFLASQQVERFLDPKTYSQTISDLGESYARLLEDLPYDFRLILKNLARGNLVFKTVFKDFEKHASHQNKLANRMIVGFLGTLLLVLGLVFHTVHTYTEPQNTKIFLDIILVILGLVLLLYTWLGIRRSGGL